MKEEMHANWGAEQLASERTLLAAEAVYSPSEPRAQARDAQVQATTTGYRIACVKAGGANRPPRGDSHGHAPGVSPEIHGGLHQRSESRTDREYGTSVEAFGRRLAPVATKVVLSPAASQDA